MIILIVDKLYLLPLSVPLDTKPDSRRSATYLAKNIAQEAKCDDISLALINFNPDNHATVFDFGCTFTTDTYAYFNIYIFLDRKTKDEMIKNRNENNPVFGYHKQCFKKGSAYMICESHNDRDAKGKPIFYGQKYYKQFPGEDLEYTVN